MISKECQEAVLVVPREILDAVCPQTFCRESAQIKSAILNNCSFIDRDIVEQDGRYKQVIPYVVIQHQNRYLLIQRTPKQTEARLHNLFSLGIGGHVNDDDSSGKSCDIITSGMQREFDEEIRLEAGGPCKLIGVINDDSTEVARFHVGFVHLLIATSPRFTILEQGKYTAAWKSPDEISNYYDQMESWAQIIHDYILFPAATDRAQKWEVCR
jgi:predicted NUDIX family phosphoesterase